MANHGKLGGVELSPPRFPVYTIEPTRRCPIPSAFRRFRSVTADPLPGRPPGRRCMLLRSQQDATQFVQTEVACPRPVHCLASYHIVLFWKDELDAVPVAFGLLFPVISVTNGFPFFPTALPFLINARGPLQSLCSTAQTISPVTLI